MPAEPDTTLNNLAPITEAEEDADLAMDDAAETVAADAQGRLWLRAILPLIQVPPPAPEGEDGSRFTVSAGVQNALDSLVITACARVKRILRSDLAGR